MKYTALIFFALLSLAVAQPVTKAANETVVTTAAPVLPTLAEDLIELKSLMHLNDIKSLINLYLLKDAEFQGVIRVLNSYEAYLAFMKLATQQEMVAFRTWVAEELRLSDWNRSSDGGDLEIIHHCGNSVYGWQGFLTEFHILYPEYTIRQQILLKEQRGGVFAQFWQRIRGLRVVFDRFLLFPETQQIITLLQEQNVDVLQMENFIRTQFDWVVVPTPVTNAEPAVEVEPVPAP